MKITRRNFVKASSVTVAASVLPANALTVAIDKETTDQATGNNLEVIEGLTRNRPAETRQGDMLYRQLGSTGAEVSIIGMGGYHMGNTSDANAAVQLIRAAIDHGITFMDNCWDYNQGESEIRLGKALQDGYRNRVFLMTKIDGRTKSAATQQIDESLRRLQTDHLDLLQHHEVIRLDDPDRIFGTDGAQEAILAAQKAGKTRFIGFTGHKDPFVHLRMLDTAQQRGFHFDAVQMPINVMDAHFRSFTTQVLPRLLEAKIGPLAMKTFGDDFILQSNTVQPIDALHYSFTLPVSVVITGMEDQSDLKQALEAVRSFKPLDQAELAKIFDLTKLAATKGDYEKYKTSTHFDGTIHHPEYLG